MISIIVPVYNAENSIESCINSILNQSYTDIELILVDDGSRDNSLKICNEKAKNDTRITVIHQENGGVSSARNNGLMVARGEYIQFVDSDDTIEHDMTETLLSMMEKSKADLVVCGYNNIRNGIANTVKPKQGIYSIKDYYGFMAYWQFSPIIGSTWNKLFKKRLIDKENIQFEIGESYAEDYMFNLEYLFYTNKIIVSDKCLYNYQRDTVDSLTKVTINRQDEIWERQKKIVEVLEQFVNLNNDDSSNVGLVSQIFSYSFLSGYITRNMMQTKDQIISWCRLIGKNYNYRNYLIRTNKIYRNSRLTVMFKIARNVALGKWTNLSFMLWKTIYTFGLVWKKISW